MYATLSMFYHFLAHYHNLPFIKDTVGVGGGFAVFEFVRVDEAVVAELLEETAERRGRSPRPTDFALEVIKKPPIRMAEDIGLAAFKRNTTVETIDKSPTLDADEA